MQLEKSHIHVAGIAGVGMSALAQVLMARGAMVSGSDRHLDQGRELASLTKLRRAGVNLTAQDGSGLAATTRALVVSTAIENDNPEIMAARRHGVPVLHRAAMLAELARDKKVIAITGTAGKTTVTGMIGFILEQLGWDPMVVNGGAVLNWVSQDCIGNVRVGRGDHWVLEVDESDRSLLNFSPDWAVITNASKDHFALDEVESLFRQFAAKTRHAIVGWGGAQPFPPPDFQPHLLADGVSFAYRAVDFQVPMLGWHNAENALQAVLMCEQLGLELRRVADALRGFRGIERRLELAGCRDGITVIDDYAHNPAKISAAWQALTPHFRRILAVWRPHGYAPLRLMLAELAEAFNRSTRAGDRLWFLPVYDAGGSATRTVSSEDLVTLLAGMGTAARTVADYDLLFEQLKAQAGAGDAILIMGARDPGLPVFARRLIAHL